MRHNSNASISEPSLIPPLNNGRPRKFPYQSNQPFQLFFLKTSFFSCSTSSSKFSSRLSVACGFYPIYTFPVCCE
jgi:hypothetical protein